RECSRACIDPVESGCQCGSLGVRLILGDVDIDEGRDTDIGGRRRVRTREYCVGQRRNKCDLRSAKAAGDALTTGHALPGGECVAWKNGKCCGGSEYAKKISSMHDLKL